MSADGEALRAAERAARESYGRLVAILSARTRDLAGAEDALGEAFAAALATWPRDGVPANPDAWLLTVARRRQARAAGGERAQRIPDELEAAVVEPAAIPDRRLALMFACTHPAIERGIRAPLILQTILGFTAQEVAGSFLVPPATMGQRLARAKTRIRDAGIPFDVPEPEQLSERLRAVLDAVYATYARGWSETGDAGTPESAEEALWLGRTVVSLLPAEPEAKGLLALMLYAEARRAARRDGEGAYVPLEEQDVGLWDAARIARAEGLLREASTGGPTGRYQLEAAIQSAHVARRLTGARNWPAVVELYDHLLALTRSPVVALNRAVALAEVEGPEAALSAIAALAEDERMLGYQPYWAARGHLLARAGKPTEAAEALTVATGLTADEAARAFLRRRLGALREAQGR